jgi:hypothetical protein
MPAGHSGLGAHDLSRPANLDSRSTNLDTRAHGFCVTLLGLLGPSARLLNPLSTNKTPLLSRYREQVATRSVNLPFENEERIMPVLFLWAVPAVILIGGASDWFLHLH